ncbi:hypothetical protein DOY81_007716 [Sarcophaga bullata]|nr:hypothetical protein DOY81_007716 [Sarcophaga bullata]
MNTYEIQTYNDLELELEKAKDTLVVINDSIKRIVGRAPKLSRDSRGIRSRTPSVTAFLSTHRRCPPRQ